MYAYSNPCPASGLPARPPRKGVGGTRAEPLLSISFGIVSDIAEELLSGWELN